MKILYGFLTSLLLFTGCSPFSPQLQQPINNQGGKIDQIDSMQNSMRAEILSLKNHQTIQDSQIDKIMTGLVNLQNNSSYNGVQILSGSGGLLLGLFGIVIIGGFAYFYKKEAEKNAKAADIMAETIVKEQNPKLEDEVFKAVMYTDVESEVYHAIKKYQNALGNK